MRLYLILAIAITIILGPLAYKEWCDPPKRFVTCAVEQEQLGPYQTVFVVHDGDEKFYLMTPDGFGSTDQSTLLTYSSLHHTPVTITGRTGWFNFKRYLFVEKVRE